MTIPYRLIRNTQEWEAVIIDESQPLFCDTETMPERGATDLSKSPGGLYGAIRLYQFYQSSWSEAILVDLCFVELEIILDKIKDCHHVYHNASFDLHTVNCHTKEYWFPEKVSDTFYLAKAVYTDKEKFDFYACLKYCKAEDDFIRDIDKKANQKSDWAKALTEQQLLYAAADVLYLSLLYEAVKVGMDEACQLDHDNLRYAIQYDRLGLPISKKAINILRREQLLKLEKHQALVPVNINSPKQCKSWLKTESTDAYVIGTMALKGNKDAENLVQARHAHKALQFIEKYDAPYIRAFHNSAGARTSRMTCTGGDRLFCENNQNPPRLLYPAFQAPSGKRLIYNDYAGLELRMAVAYVGEPNMARLIKEGIDMHDYNTMRIFDESEDTFTKQQRWVTKVFTFSSIYGAGPVELQNQLQAKGRILIDFDEVKRIGKAWFEIYPHFKAWHEMHRQVFRVYGYIDCKTLLGRVLRATRLNDTFNYPIQGSAAEVTKLAVHYLYERYGNPQISNVVHDSITLLWDEDKAEEWVPRLNECMTDAWRYVIKDAAIPDLPMEVNAEIGTVYPGVDETKAELQQRGIWND